MPAAKEYKIDRDETGMTAQARNVLALLQEKKRPQEICDQLGISKPRFYQYRTRLIEAGFDITNPDTPRNFLESIRARDERHVEANEKLPFGATADRHRLIGLLDQVEVKVAALAETLTRPTSATNTALAELTETLKGNLAE
jgi:hypothetical protein